MAEMDTASLERGRGKINGLTLTHNGSKFTDARTWLLGRSPSLLETQMVCRKLSRDNTGWLHFAQNRGSWEQFSKCGKPCVDGPGCLGDPCASGMERFGVRLVPLSLYQAKCDITLMSSWYSAGYDWPDSCGSGYGRRRGCWCVNAEDVWFCETCRMALRRYGTEVLRWNVAGGVFLSLVSLLNVGALKPGMTDFFHVGELILRPQLTDDLNDFMSASAVHMMVTNMWMNTKH